ncbi:hypothetical protein R6Q59_032224 [Mikania micrantha]|uniref:Uncharacterized protein n=1 Tax=Mikania micrantha TaxID=192012 RepID=A0A5N6NTC3_9ASTR|nr:hypothetical protein E3N88_16903 [Mikania micrantha]
MENVASGSDEVVTGTLDETRPHEFMILVGDEDEHTAPRAARIVDHQLVHVHHRTRHSLTDLNPQWCPPHEAHAREADCTRMLHYLKCGILLSMYGPLIGLVQVKFQNNHQSPFETHTLLMIMSVIAFSTSAILSFIFLVSTTTNLPSISRAIISNVIFFLAVLAPLSLVLVVFVPPKLIWIGYSIVCLLLVTIVTYSFVNYTSLFGQISATTWKAIKQFKVKR